MNPPPPPSPAPSPGDPHVPTYLDEAVPAQHEAKAVLWNEFSVFRAWSGPESLPAHPVLLAGSDPGRTPARLVRSLATQAGLPYLEVSVRGGGAVAQWIAKLARRHPQCRESAPLGIVLIEDLEDMTEEMVLGLGGQLSSAERYPHLHKGTLLQLTSRDVFWVGTMRLGRPTRPRSSTSSGIARPVPTSAASIRDILAAGPAGGDRGGGSETDRRAQRAALARFFRSEALLLPGTPEELRAWARAEDRAWWPGRRLRTYCEAHGVRFHLTSEAADALAEEAGRQGGTVDAMEARLRAAMEPVLGVLAEPGRSIAAVEVTAAAIALDEPPLLRPGVRQTVEPPSPHFHLPNESMERPARTPLSSADVRLATAADLKSISEPAGPPAGAPLPGNGPAKVMGKTSAKGRKKAGPEGAASGPAKARPAAKRKAKAAAKLPTGSPASTNPKTTPNPDQP